MRPSLHDQHQQDADAHNRCHVRPNPRRTPEDMIDDAYDQEHNEHRDGVLDTSWFHMSEQPEEENECVERDHDHKPGRKQPGDDPITTAR